MASWISESRDDNFDFLVGMMGGKWKWRGGILASELYPSQSVSPVWRGRIDIAMQGHENGVILGRVFVVEYLLGHFDRTVT